MQGMDRVSERRRAWVLLLLALLASFWSAAGRAGEPAPAAAQVAPPRIPTSAFAALPQLRGLKVAPDGRRLLGRRDVDGKPRLMVMSLTQDRPPITIGLPDGWTLSDYFWAGNDRVLLSIDQLAADTPSEDPQSRLLIYDIRAGTTRLVGGRGMGPMGDIIHIDPSGDWILLSLQKWIFDYPAVYRVDLAVNRMELVQSQRRGIWKWVADDAGVVRLGLGASGNRYQIIYRSGPDDHFRTVARPLVGDEDDRTVFDVMSLVQGSDEGYMLSNQRTGRYALYRFNYATRTLGELVFESPTNDIDRYAMTADGRRLLYAEYTDEREQVHWFDPEMARLQRRLDAALPTRRNRMVSWSDDRRTIVVRANDSNDPGSFYIYLPAERTLSPYVTQFPDLKPDRLAITEYIHYPARDGLEIPAYLTLPRGRVAQGLPLVILPHGGPFEVRDALEFDPEVQLLANRGYAVLQPNFRGSGGYGEDFSNKGYGQWGRAMQDDLDDGMDWLVRRGIADPARVCIFGSSYGGYAALWGAIRNPERYRCAVSFAGVTDLQRQLSYGNRFFIAKRYQKDWRDRIKGMGGFDLTSVSPLQQVARLRVPVLLAHGLKDPVVPYRQSSDFVAALRAAGKPVEFYSYADEGHGLGKPEDLQDWLDRLDAFLARYNPP